ncbi:MAG: FecR domain-containing protein, partial [Deltaproteobacteria bacterium]|nr:FecR domain-containing protein [Deltaproteobacteria bacterium]
MMKGILTSKAGRYFFQALLIFACITMLSAPAFSADQNIARLTKFAGKVMIKSQDAWGVKPKVGLPLYSGDKVVTRIGMATITFNDGAVMEIKANSNLMIQESQDEKSLTKKVGKVKRRLRLLLGKMLFRTGRGSKTTTSLETTTMVCGLRGTAGVLSIGAGGQAYLQFTEGGGDTVGDFISGVAEDVPPELANMNPIQRAAFVAAAAADQAAQAAEKAASGEIGAADAALAAAQAAEAAAREAYEALSAMLDNPDQEVQDEVWEALGSAEEAIEAAQDAQEEAIAAGGVGGELDEEPEGEGDGIGFIVPPQGIDILPESGEEYTLFGGEFQFNPWSVIGGFTGEINDTIGHPEYNTGNISLTGDYLVTPTGSDLAEMGGTMDDGSAFSGHLAAVAGSVNGVFSDLYLTGGAYEEVEEGVFVLNNAGVGFLYGNFSGTLVEGEEPGTGTLSVRGPAYRSGTYGTVGEIGIGTLLIDEETGQVESLQDARARTLPENFVDWGYPIPVLGALSAGGVNDGPFNVVSTEFGGLETTSGRRLGVWAVATEGGSYTNEVGSTWYGVYGDSDLGDSHVMLGRYTSKDDSFDSEAGESILAVDEFGHLDIYGRLLYLDHEYMGDVYLWNKGSYYQDASFGYDSAGAGTYILDPLAYSGTWNSIQFANQQGLIGGLTAPWDGPADFLAMGEGSYDWGEAHLWNSVIGGYGTGGYGGYFGGFTGGIGQAPAPDDFYGDMGGVARAIYLSPPDPVTLLSTAGFATGNISGEYYPGIGMWRTQGTLTPKVMATGLNPNNIFENHGMMGAGLWGQFGGDGSLIVSDDGYGETIYLYDSSTGTSLPWGAYDLKFEWGDYYDKPAGGAAWEANVGGWADFDNSRDPGLWMASVDGLWSAEAAGEGTITGDLYGRYITPTQLGKIEGPFYGLYDVDLGGDGTWIGESVGTFESKPLAWSEFGYGGLYYNDYGWLGYGGYIEGLAGGVNFPPTDFFAMGYAGGGYGGYGGSALWNFFSFGGPVTEMGYGGYGGIIDVSGGFIREPEEGKIYGVLDGDLVGIYLSETGEAGFFTGPVSGSYYPGPGYGGGPWVMEGSLTHVEKESGLNPYFIEIYEGELYDGGLIGAFDNGPGWISGDYEFGQTWFLYDWDEGTSFPWGIYDVVLG